MKYKFNIDLNFNSISLTRKSEIHVALVDNTCMIVGPSNIKCYFCHYC